MGFIYKIEVAGNLYIGSTKNKYLSNRQAIHNYYLNNINSNNYNIYLYRFCRKKKVKKIICELIEEVDNSELRLLEQEYITMLEPSLNSQRAVQTKEERIEQMKEINKIKGNCPICNKEMLKTSINKHIKSQH